MIDIAGVSKDIQITENHIRALQTETVHCIAFKPDGKIEVVDKDKLSSLNTEIDRLTELAASNKKILSTLQEMTGGKTIAEIAAQKNKLEGHIQRTKDLLRLDLSNLLKNTPSLTLENISSNAKAQRLQADAKAIFDKEGPELEEVSALLAQVDETIANYTPSGLKASIPQHTTFVGGF